MSWFIGSEAHADSFPATYTSSLDAGQTSAEQILTQLLGGGSTSVADNLFPNYTGDVTTNLSGLQTSSLAGLENAVGSVGTAAQTSGQTSTDANKSLQGILNGSPTDLTDYYNTNVYAPLKKTFEETTLPSIMSASGGSIGGPRSTAGVKAITDASRDFGDTLASTQSKLAYDTAQADAKNKLTAAGLAPSVDSSAINMLSSLLSAGSVPTTLEQSNKSLQYKTYTDEQAQTQQFLSDLLTYLGTKTQGENSVAVTPSTQGLLGQVLSAVAGVATKSDRRLKTDIKKIGESDTGYPLYVFRYKNEPESVRHIGLMAQDVEKKDPGAVVNTPEGKAVLYGRALGQLL